MNDPSSLDLHPTQGGRFVFTRRALPGAAASGLGEYAVQVYLPAARLLTSCLQWDEAGHAALDPPLEDPWAHQEALKLARVLRQSPKDRLIRWRSQP